MNRIININRNLKKAKDISHKTIAKDELNNAIAKLLIILASHFITAFFAMQVVNIFVVLFIEVLTLFAFIATSKAMIALRQKQAKQGDLILIGKVYEVPKDWRFMLCLSMLIVISYMAVIVTLNTKEKTDKASSRKFTESEILQLESIKNKFKRDSVKHENSSKSLLNELERQIQNEIASKQSSLKNALIEVNNNITYRNKYNFDNSVFLMQKKNIENRLSNIKPSDELLRKKDKAVNELSDSISKASNIYSFAITAMNKAKENEVKENILSAQGFLYLTDAFLLFVIVIQHFCYYYLVLYFAMSKFKLSYFNEKDYENVGLSITKQQFEVILKNISINEKQVRFRDLINWKLRQDSRLFEVQAILEKSHIIIEFSEKGYPKAKKIG